MAGFPEGQISSGRGLTGKYINRVNQGASRVSENEGSRLETARVRFLTTIADTDERDA
jgi:hypothetical protein